MRDYKVVDGDIVFTEERMTNYHKNEYDDFETGRLTTMKEEEIKRFLLQVGVEAVDKHKRQLKQMLGF